MLVRERIIVLDDLERRDAALSLETLFGYVDALKGKGCTVLLIYNEEELSTNQGKGMARRAGEMPGRGDQPAAHAGRCLRIGLVASLPGPRAYRRHGRGRRSDQHPHHPAHRATDRCVQEAIPGREPQQPLPEYILRSLVFLAVLHYENRFPDKQVETFLEDWTRVCADQLGNTLPGDAAPAGRAMQRHQRHRTAVPAVGLRAASPARRGPRDGQDAGAR